MDSTLVVVIGGGVFTQCSLLIYKFDLPGELSVAQIAIRSLARLGPKLLVVTQLKLETSPAET